MCEAQEILKKLIEVVELCETKYSGKKELATENDILVLNLCNLWEDALNCGLRTNKTINDFTELFKNVQNMVSGNGIASFSFWDFCKNHLTYHERERFENLKNIVTKDGRMRALIRSSLNEHALQRYIRIWLSDPCLEDIYESNALMVNPEITNLLPILANSLNTILFAINIDCSSLNIGKHKILEEPIIYAPTPTSSSKKALAIERNIISFENDDVQDAVKILDKINTKEIKQSEEITSHSKDYFNEYNNQSTSKNSNEINFKESKNNPSFEANKNSNTVEIKEYLHSLGHKNFYDNDSSDKEYLESDTSSNLSKSVSYSATNLSNSYTPSLVSEPHVNELEKIKTLEQQLKMMTERCSLLESRVAELSLENHRLQKLKNYIDNDFGNYNVTIPKVNLVKDKSSKHYIYEIHITSREQESWIISRRYSDFYKLYQHMLKKHNNLVKAIDFPPKKKLGNMNASFVEERRQRLQIYLRSLLKILPEILFCTSREELEGVLPFFN